jgi:Na+-translocating ferredoxin:NAD+ oxidoreductase subunit B
VSHATLTDERNAIDSIDALLPQTQCGQCGYAGCRPYASAIAAGTANINQCPPGGDEGIRALALLLQLDYVPLNTSFGVTKPPAVALIDETHCIGCTLCIQACPVDAIIGANKLMHTVITNECTGCELCLAPCPVDCINMASVTRPRSPAGSAALWRSRYLAREQRLALQRSTAGQRVNPKETESNRRKREILDKALLRAQVRIEKNINKNN